MADERDWKHFAKMAKEAQKPALQQADVMRNEALCQPIVIGSVCTCTKFRQTPMINGKHICSICNKPIVQTDH
jgi:hypothetical protein